MSKCLKVGKRFPKATGFAGKSKNEALHSLFFHHKPKGYLNFLNGPPSIK